MGESTRLCDRSYCWAFGRKVLSLHFRRWQYLKCPKSKNCILRCQCWYTTHSRSINWPLKTQNQNKISACAVTTRSKRTRRQSYLLLCVPEVVYRQKFIHWSKLTQSHNGLCGVGTIVQSLVTHCLKFSSLSCLPAETIGAHDSVSPWGRNVMNTDSWYPTHQRTHDDTVNNGGPASDGSKHDYLHCL